MIGALALSAAACASHHTGNGLVLRVDRPGAVVTISHDALAGVMRRTSDPEQNTGRHEHTTDGPWNAKAAKPAKPQNTPIFFATFARFAFNVVLRRY